MRGVGGERRGEEKEGRGGEGRGGENIEVVLLPYMHLQLQSLVHNAHTDDTVDLYLVKTGMAAVLQIDTQVPTAACQLLQNSSCSLPAYSSVAQTLTVIHLTYPGRSVFTYRLYCHLLWHTKTSLCGGLGTRLHQDC